MPLKCEDKCQLYMFIVQVVDTCGCRTESVGATCSLRHARRAVTRCIDYTHPGKHSFTSNTIIPLVQTVLTEGLHELIEVLG